MRFVGTYLQSVCAHSDRVCNACTRPAAAPRAAQRPAAARAARGARCSGGGRRSKVDGSIFTEGGAEAYGQRGVVKGMQSGPERRGGAAERPERRGAGRAHPRGRQTCSRRRNGFVRGRGRVRGEQGHARCVSSLGGPRAPGVRLRRPKQSAPGRGPGGYQCVRGYAGVARACLDNSRYAGCGGYQRGAKAERRARGKGQQPMPLSKEDGGAGGAPGRVAGGSAVAGGAAPPAARTSAR